LVRGIDEEGRCTSMKKDHFEEMEEVWKEFDSAIDSYDVEALKRLVSSNRKLSMIPELRRLFFFIKEMEKHIEVPQAVFDAIVGHAYGRLDRTKCPSCKKQMMAAYACWEMFGGVLSACPSCKKLFVFPKGIGPQEVPYEEGEKPEDFIWTRQNFRRYFFEE